MKLALQQSWSCPLVILLFIQVSYNFTAVFKELVPRGKANLVMKTEAPQTVWACMLVTYEYIRDVPATTLPDCTLSCMDSPPPDTK